MTTVSGTFTAVGQSTTLDVTSLGEDITISLSGGATATVLLQREKVPYADVWHTIRTYYGDIETSFRQERKNERYRFNVVDYTTGTVTYSVSDGDKRVGPVGGFYDDEGNEIIQYTQAGIQVPGTLIVDGASTLTGAVTLAGALALDDTTASTSGTTGSLQTDGGLGVALDIFSDGTINPVGDTSASDLAAIGHNITDGLVLTGQGSTNDVIIKNDAASDVLRIPTGTTGVTLAGALTDGAASTLTTGATIGTVTIADGSITDSSNAIDFGNEALSTTGLITSAGLITSLNLGTGAGAECTAVEYGDGYNHVTVITCTAADLTPALSSSGAEGIGAIIYTFPAGVYVAQAVHVDLTAVVAAGFSNAVDFGLGSVIASGDIATLNGTTMEDWLAGQTIADISSPATEKSTVMTNGSPLLFEASGSHVLNLNMAGTWTAAADTIEATAVVTIWWTFLGA